MKLDMGRVWNETVAKLSANSALVLVVAGVFFFLPYLALSLFMPAEVASLQSGNRQPDFEQLSEILVEFYRGFWWVFVLIGVVQAIGTLVLMILLADRSRPTLGEVLVLAAKLFLPFFAAQLISGFAMMLVVMIPVMIGAIGGASGSSALVVLAVVLGIAGVIAMLYIYTKFSLVSATIAVEREMNPIAALRRSWRATKGNSVLLFLFYVLLFIAIAIVGFMISGIGSLIFALTGAEIAHYGNGIVSSLVNAASASLMAGIVLCAYLQLTGDGAAAMSETFE